MEDFMFNFLKRLLKKAPKYKPEEIQEVLNKYGALLNEMASKREILELRAEILIIKLC